MAREIDSEELAWAKECVSAGDSLADLAAASGRAAAEWAEIFANLDAPVPITDADQFRVRRAVEDLGVRTARRLSWEPAFEGLFPTAQRSWSRPAEVTVQRNRRGSRWQARFTNGEGAIFHLRTTLAHLSDGACEIVEHAALRKYFVRSERGAA